MKHPVCTVSFFSCLLCTLGHAHVITGDSTQIDVSDGISNKLYINNYAGDSAISIPTEYKQVYVLGSAEIAPFSDTGRSLYVESNSSILVNGDVSAKIVQSQEGVSNSTIDITGNVTVNSMFSLASPTNTARIGGSLTINGLSAYVENDSDVYAGGVLVSKALTGFKIAGNIYTNSFTTNAATTTLQAGSLLSHLDPAAEGSLLINSGSTVVCSGTVELDTELQGGTFSLNEAALVSALTLQSSTVKVQGDAQTGALTLNGGSLVFSAGASLNLNGAALFCDDSVAITVNVDDIDNLTDSIILFDHIAADSLLPDTLTVTLADKTASKQREVSIQNGAVIIPIPEPTTATLSLLALAALAARRRRRR